MIDLLRGGITSKTTIRVVLLEIITRIDDQTTRIEGINRIIRMKDKKEENSILIVAGGEAFSHDMSITCARNNGNDVETTP